MRVYGGAEMHMPLPPARAAQAGPWAEGRFAYTPRAGPRGAGVKRARLDAISPGQGLWRTLTAREMEIAQFVAAGKRNKEVARELGLSRYTVETHLKNIYAKLQIQSRTELTNIVRDIKVSQSSAGA